MLVKSITLKNFRQYKGEQKIDFSVDPDKNITVIKGENGAGKTTLLESFSWCLYKKLNLPNKDRLLNTDLANRLKPKDTAELFVKINLEHNNTEYFIKRSEEFMKKDNEDLDRKSRDFNIQMKKNDGTLKDIKRPKREIDNILPDDLSTYFFFDGERIENLSKSNRKGKKDLSEAVKNILGLDILLNAEKHLRKLVKEFESDYNDDNSSQMKSLREELREDRKKEKKYKKLVNTNEEEIEEVKEKIEELTEKIKANASAAEKQKAREQYEDQIESLERDIEALKEDIEKINKDNLPEFIASKLLSLCRDKFDLSELESKGISGIDGSAIDSIIESGRCICGQKIKKGEKHYQKLLEQKKYQPPASLGTIIIQFNDKTEDVKNKGSNFVNSFEEKYKDIERKRDQIENLERKVEEISQELRDAEDVKELEEKKENHEEELEELKDKHTDNLSELKKVKGEIENKEAELDKLALNSTKNTKIAVRKRYANEVKKEILEYYKKKEEEVREKLNAKVSEVFDQLIETNHKIEINDDYTFRVIDIDGEDATSQGQDVITSFAFIGGLIKLAKERHEDIEVTEPYPLIMDAPFAKLSKAHRKNVANVLPEIVEQFILFTVDSQYEGDIEEAIQGQIGKEYELDMKIEDEKYTEVIGG
ncbi:hypothetical protein Halha_2159 [Halobacteroides halobius DSM 5150]|uniref:Nuclease SbcCD subunit C n=1 Tax=Halobacteroides halobius (strain ATCC 35273 / DSM 5150 / MD-1) TaxID=748449 RepID=L0K9Q9_HALHC|nr:AAA family ATPase [Halobacteroides halobius]AGB42042.1 hypothetical protein Halha_2159 [Halobacteroides halobius DSM 5150]